MTQTKSQTEENNQPEAMETETGGTPDASVPDWQGIELEFSDEVEQPGENVAEVDSTSGVLSKDEFFGVFQMMFSAPNMLPISPFPLESLPISIAEKPQARAASDSIHDLALENRFLRWLIEPGNKYIQAALVIGTFTAGKFMAVRAELKIRNAEPISPTPAGASANGPTIDGDFTKL